MSKIVNSSDSAEAIIFVDQNGCDIATGQKVCEVGDAVPVILVSESGNNIQ